MRIFLSALLVFFSSEAFPGTMDSCLNLSDIKLPACMKEIVASSTWEPLKSNLASSLKKSNNTLNIKFDSKLGRAAITKVELKNNHYVPVIVLGKNADAHELLITLNHELVHYLSTFDRLAFVFDGAKIGNCLSKYQLMTLKDEAIAFDMEVLFWNNAPAEFKNHFKNIFFNSKIFQKKLNYDEFYKLLQHNVAEDKNFILKKYIDMGEYSQCAKGII